jgi:ABC-type multidrug transport system ATPase subunit
LQERWGARRDEQIGMQAVASDRAGGITATIRFSRQVIQVIILGGGAYLAITGSISVGSIIGASILVGRALAPTEVAVAHWRTFVNARDALLRLRELFASIIDNQVWTSLPRARGNISVENVVVMAPNSKRPTLRAISFQIPAGTVLAIVGPSAAGKSTLLRTMLGIWPIASGMVRMDGSELSHWNRAELGPNVGYLPQDVELFDGTIAQNIARFTKCDSLAVIEAARVAGIHDMVQHLSDGYDTRIGDGGATLSAGQRQRVGLARAVFGEPSIVFLDEPNANLDARGEEALIQAIQQLNSRGKTVVFVTHKPGLLLLADKLLLLNDGVVHAFGDCEGIMRNSLAESKLSPANLESEIQTSIDGWKRSFFREPSGQAPIQMPAPATQQLISKPRLVSAPETSNETATDTRGRLALGPMDRVQGSSRHYRNELNGTEGAVPRLGDREIFMTSGRVAAEDFARRTSEAQELTPSASETQELGARFWDKCQIFTHRSLSEHNIAYMFIDGIAVQLVDETEFESMLVAWAYTMEGRQLLLHLKPGSLEDPDTTDAFFEEMKSRGLNVPLLVTSGGVSAVINAIERFVPSASRQRCLSSRLRELAAKVPVERWRQFKDRVKTAYQAPNRLVAEERAKVIVSDYAMLPGAIRCFTDDFDACVAHLRFPLEHRSAINSMKLLDHISSDPRQQVKLLRLMCGSLFAMDGRQAITVTELELRQMAAARKDENQEWEHFEGRDSLGVSQN